MRYASYPKHIYWGTEVSVRRKHTLREGESSEQVWPTWNPGS